MWDIRVVLLIDKEYFKASFSRVPCVDELITFNKKRYTVIGVVHHSEINLRHEGETYCASIQLIEHKYHPYNI